MPRAQILEADKPVLDAEDTVRVTYLGSYGVLHFDKKENESTIEIVEGPLPINKFNWNAKDYLGGMEKGDDRLVPFDVVRVFFGDPRAKLREQQRTVDRQGNVGDIAPREVEVHRLSVLYGLYDTSSEELGRFVPAVRVETTDGTEIVTVAADPEGTLVYGHLENEEDVHDVATQLAKLKATVKMLEEAQRAETTKGRKNDGSDVKTDGPPV